MNNSIKDKDIIHGLINNESEIINYLYAEIGPMVRHLIMRGGGSEEEANDIFQEGIITAYENIKSGKYEHRESTRFSTYLIQVCKFKWYDILKSPQKTRNSSLEIDVEDEADIITEIIRQEKYKKLHQLLDELGKQCKEILKRYYWEKESMETISIVLNMQPKSVKNGKYRCMEKLRELAIKLN